MRRLALTREPPPHLISHFETKLEMCDEKMAGN